LSEPLEVCDETGATVGHFLPASAYRKLLYQIAESQCPHTPEELRARREKTGGTSLADIWKDLEKA